MVEIIITENEARNEYLLTPSQTFLGARYDNLSDEIKIIFPQREIDNESICTMIITSSFKEVDCVTVRHNEIFKLHSPMSQYRQVSIGFSFQKNDGYIKNSNIGLFYFREAQYPDENVPIEPIQREKINLMLATGFSSVEWSKDNSNILEFKNIDGEVVETVEIKIDTEEIDARLEKVEANIERVEADIERVESKINSTDYIKNTDYASETDINEKAVNNKYLSPENVDKIIKVGLTTNAETLTDEEKTQAQNWLGITELVGDIDTLLEKLDTGSGV